MLPHYFNNFIEALKYKRHLAPSLYSCLFVWDKTTVDTGTDQKPSIYTSDKVWKHYRNIT